MNEWQARQSRRDESQAAGPQAWGRGTLLLALLVTALPVRAEDNLGLRLSLDSMPFGRGDHLMALSLVLMVIAIFAAVTAMLHIRSRSHWQGEERALKQQISDLLLVKDRSETILAAEPQVIVTWNGRDAEPEIIGDCRQVLDIPVARRVLGYGTWLNTKEAQELEKAVETLKNTGERFSMIVRSSAGRFVSVQGFAVSGRAVMRLSNLGPERQERARIEALHEALIRETSALKGLLNAIPQPVWLRDSAGALVFVNNAYTKSVEAPDAATVIAKKLEFFEEKSRQEILRATPEQPFHGRASAIISGRKHIFDVANVVSDSGSGGIATDVTELETARADLASLAESHARTLDQLPIAVAIFDNKQSLQFHNAAYEALWQIDPAFLRGHPSDSAILDRLRAERRLPEQADFRDWKRSVLEGYRTLDTLERWWYLPDGRTLRVVTNPNPQGGVTYLFDDVTERFSLESRFNALSRVQGETLDTLKEAVAVFGSDGKLKLSNPSFRTIWGIDAASLADEPHIDAIVQGCGACAQNQVWEEIRSAVTGLHDSRQPILRRMEKPDGMTIDCATAPLPDGATLVTFADVTASVNAERMLKERNEALEAASQIKNNFVHTVSYELRTPLQNIVGFTEALAEGSFGTLNEQQRDYLAHIASSTDTLRALVEDILELANIDAGNIELETADVDVPSTIEAAIAGLRDRIEAMKLRVHVRISQEARRFVADGKRVRQVLFNLLKNAVAYSSPGQVVNMEAFVDPGFLVLRVSDQGRGIPPDVIAKVFERFEARTIAGENKGVGLGLAIVRSFVELHGGTVSLTSEEGKGTVVTCRFPLTGPAPLRAAA